MVALVRSGLRVQRRLRRVTRQLPLIDAYPAGLGTGVSHLDEWLTNPGRADPYWASLEIEADRPVPPIPASLVVGPWTHASGFSQGLPVVLGEALSWLRAYTADGQTLSPVPNENLRARVHVGGSGPGLRPPRRPVRPAVRRGPPGRSRNVCDGIIRHRVRLQVSGGAHPRFARNTGSGEPPATATRLAAVDVQIVHEVSDRPCCRFRSGRPVAIYAPGMGHWAVSTPAGA